MHLKVTRQSENCHTSGIPYAMYNDEKKLEFFLLSNPILKYVQYMNKLFELKNIDKMKLLHELVLLFETLVKDQHYQLAR